MAIFIIILLFVLRQTFTYPVVALIKRFTELRHGSFLIRYRSILNLIAQNIASFELIDSKRPTPTLLQSEGMYRL